MTANPKELNRDMSIMCEECEKKDKMLAKYREMTEKQIYLMSSIDKELKMWKQSWHTFNKEIRFEDTEYFAAKIATDPYKLFDFKHIERTESEEDIIAIKDLYVETYERKPPSKKEFKEQMTKMNIGNVGFNYVNVKMKE